LRKWLPKDSQPLLVGIADQQGFIISALFQFLVLQVHFPVQLHQHQLIRHLALVLAEDRQEGAAAEAAAEVGKE
jgi:hypothetical protein